MQTKTLSCIKACCLIVTVLSTAAVTGAGFNEALDSGKASLDMRLRYEAAEDSLNKDARAATLRTRLGYRTGDYRAFFAFGEFEDVRVVAGLDDYAPEKQGYATVADPEVTQLNQALLGYRGLPDTTLKLGRQRLILDNARFVGNVGWRQNEQTFDALSLVNTALPDTTLTYAFLDKVNGILREFDADVSDHLLHAAYRGFSPLAVTVYAYLLEDDDSGAENDTFGLRVKGDHAVTPALGLLYTLEWARQHADDRTNDYTADYGFLEAGLRYGRLTFKAGYEVLGSDDGTYGFQTPLATKHAFNGWADLFLSTPDGGLRDLMFTVSGRMAGVKLAGVYHDFSADSGGSDYGSELDLLATRKFTERYRLGIKYAAYRANEWKADTDKLWLWGQLRL